MNRRALFDIGVAGPLAGFAVALVALIVGLFLSTVVDRTSTFGLQLGEPLLLKLMAWLIVGPLPPQADVLLHPVAFAAWFGLFVTSLNLHPYRPARWRARGLCLVGKSPADDGLCCYSVADHVGIRRMAWVVHLGVHGGCLGHRSSAGR